MKDIIYVEHKNYVSVKETSLCFKNVIDQSEKYIPFDDIGTLIFDNIESYFSNKVVNECVKNNIGLIFCDTNHSPISEIQSNFSHRRKLQRLTSQLSISQKTRFRLWKKIISSKIINQAECILASSNNSSMYNELAITSKEVKDGDIDNREAYAANIYFDCLFGNEFKRGRYQDIINSSLNYGYALIRSVIKKELAVHGFEMSLGIFHKSTENPYNLSDDLIEPFRPFVDALVFHDIVQSRAETFSREHRIKLLQVLIEKCVIDSKVYTLSDAVRCCVESLIHCYDNDSAKYLKLPSFIELR